MGMSGRAGDAADGHAWSLLDSVPDALVVFDEPGTVVEANPAAERLFGLGADELVGRHHGALCHGLGHELAGVRALFGADGSAREAPANRTLTGQRRDGTLFPVEVRLGPLRRGERLLVVASFRDVSHHQRTETELRDAMALVNATLESTADGILVVSSDGKIAGANHRFATMWGIPADLLESEDDDLVMSFVLNQLSDSAAFVAKVHELYEHPEEESNDVLDFRDGRTFERYSRPQRVGDEIVGRVWSFRDVTPRERAQEEARVALARLSSADARFRSLVESSDDSIVSTTGTGVITSWNAAAERLFGYGRNEILGRSFDLLVPLERRAEAHAIQRLAGAEGSIRRSLEADFVRKDGTLVPVSLTVSPIYDGSDIVGVSAIIRDVTEARAHQQELMETRAEAVAASRAKSEFLATMSHEIRTPMNGVIGLTGLLLNTPLDETQRRYATGVRGAGEALLGIIDDILDFSKLEAGKVDLEQVSFVPRALVREVGVLLASSAADKGLEFATVCDPDVPALVQGDPGRLRQVLINLAGNAVKFTEAGRVEVRVSTVAQGRREDDDLATLRFEVRDTGIGIEPAVQTRLFEPFSQADASTTRRFGGTGLGLAISRRLVEAMGGHLVVSSRPGAGSTFGFTLVLPVHATSEVREDPAPAPSAPVSATRPGIGRVLVAEDNPVNQMVATGVLNQLGYDVLVVADGQQALDALAGDSFDAVLMDVHMPVLDGFAATRELRRREDGGRRTPVIAMTAGVLDEDRNRCLAAGMDDFVAKPVDVHLLRGTLERWTGQVEPREVLEHTRLEELRALGPADGWGILPAMVTAFLDSSERELTELRSAASAGDDEAVTRLVHSTRGAAANLGARPAAEACARVEERVRATGHVPDRLALDELGAELAAARDALREYVAEGRAD